MISPPVFNSVLRDFRVDRVCVFTTSAWYPKVSKVQIFRVAARLAAGLTRTIHN
jgi:hypothetical protein